MDALGRVDVRGPTGVALAETVYWDVSCRCIDGRRVPEHLKEATVLPCLHDCEGVCVAREESSSSNPWTPKHKGVTGKCKQYWIKRLVDETRRQGAAAPVPRAIISPHSVLSSYDVDSLVIWRKTRYPSPIALAAYHFFDDQRWHSWLENNYKAVERVT